MVSSTSLVALLDFSTFGGQSVSRSWKKFSLKMTFKTPSDKVCFCYFGDTGNDLKCLFSLTAHFESFYFFDSVLECRLSILPHFHFLFIYQRKPSVEGEKLNSESGTLGLCSY